MRILIDYQIWINQNYGGISRYFSELLRLSKNDINNEYILPKIYASNFYLKKLNHINYKYVPPYNFKGKKKLLKNLNKFFSIQKILKSNFDIFHPTYHDIYFLDIIGDKPYILTVHDLIHEIYKIDSKAHERELNNIRISIKNAQHLIAISHSTKRDLINYYNIEPKKISVIYHGAPVPIKTEKVKRSSAVLKMPKKYFLYVGRRNGYKNFRNLAKAFSILKRDNDDFFLVCVGGESLNKNDIKFLERINIKDRIIFWGNVSDKDLSELYSNAVGFVFPSKYEGFGLPLLEAFSNGCPVIISDINCFKEIVKDAGLYFDPNSIEDIAQKMKILIDNFDLRKELILRGYKRLKAFSWEKTYQETLNVYKIAISAHN